MRARWTAPCPHLAPLASRRLLLRLGGRGQHVAPRSNAQHAARDVGREAVVCKRVQLPTQVLVHQEEQLRQHVWVVGREWGEPSH